MIKEDKHEEEVDFYGKSKSDVAGFGEDKKKKKKNLSASSNFVLTTY